MDYFEGARGMAGHFDDSQLDGLLMELNVPTPDDLAWLSIQKDLSRLFGHDRKGSNSGRVTA